MVKEKFFLLDLALFHLIDKLLLRFGLLLGLMDLAEVVFLQLVEELLDFIRVRKEESVIVVVVRHINKVEVHKLIEAVLPFLIGNACMDSPPLFGLPTVWIGLIHSVLLG